VSCCGAWCWPLSPFAAYDASSRGPVVDAIDGRPGRIVVCNTVAVLSARLVGKMSEGVLFRAKLIIQTPKVRAIGTIDDGASKLVADQTRKLDIVRAPVQLYMLAIQNSPDGALTTEGVTRLIAKVC
jgi:hypothetical protein